MTPQNEQEWTAKILNGPSKMDLMLALFDRKSNGAARTVKFHCSPCLQEAACDIPPACIARVAKMGDPNDEKWEIEAFIPGAKKGNNFLISYSTKDRKGCIILEDL